MKFVKRILLNGRVEFTRTYYAVFSLTVLSLIASIGLVIALIVKLAAL